MSSKVIRMFVDIHTHILHGVDDGPKTLEKSMEMIRAAYESGVRIILATPHYGMWGITFDKDKAEKNLKELKEAAKKEFPDIAIGMGNEIYYSRGVVEDLHSGKTKTLANTKYVLVEFSPDHNFSEIKEGLHNILQTGYRPVVAHAERYKALQLECDRVAELVDMGTYIQINANSLLGKRNDIKFKTCKLLLNEDLVHFVASDCHNSTTRRPNLAEAAHRLEKMTDADTVNRLLIKNPVLMIKNEFL